MMATEAPRIVLPRQKGREGIIWHLFPPAVSELFFVIHSGSTCGCSQAHCRSEIVPEQNGYFSKKKTHTEKNSFHSIIRMEKQTIIMLEAWSCKVEDWRG